MKNERLTLLDEPPGILKQLTAIDGPPGAGKTTFILDLAQQQDKSVAIVTYTNAAADVVKERLGDSPISVGTIYKLTWNPIKTFTGLKQGRGPKAVGPWLTRPIEDSWDTALTQYVDSAPSRLPPSEAQEAARQLHAWDEGPCPLNIKGTAPVGPLKYPLALADWIEKGKPSHKEDLFDLILIDEAQDMSTMELEATMGLLDKGGEAIAFMDPGQAIFSHAKGIEDNSLAPAWVKAGTRYRLMGGFRVGNPAASLASRVLKPFFDRPSESFASGKTSINSWEPDQEKPLKGLVLGYSRAHVAKCIERWDLQRVGLVPGQGNPDKELVMSTIHSAKGAEADDVFLLPWTRPALERLESFDPRELRTAYVALTRARNNLHLPWNLQSRIEYF
jgi:hypothetical protein